MLYFISLESSLTRDPASPMMYLPAKNGAAMATHKINVKLPATDVMNVDVTFVVHRDNAKLGELHVSRGSIDWKPANARGPIRKSWAKFNELMANS
jgi:hypothetical protein